MLDISNSVVSAMERKPAKPKEERIELAEIKQQELIKERQLVAVSVNQIENNSDLTTSGQNDFPLSMNTSSQDDFPLDMTTSGQDDFPMSMTANGQGEIVRDKNDLPKALFKLAIKEGTFEDVFGDEFEYLSYERVKELLIMYKNSFHDKQYMKLQSFVNEGIKKSKKGD